MLDWGICPKLTLKIRTDSSAAKGFATRRGLGRQRHVSIRFLWLQDKVSKGELKVVKVGTADQLADFLTKPVTARWLAEKSPELGLEFRDGRSLYNVDWFPDGRWILQMVGAGTNVYVFDMCINVNNGTLAEGAINRVQLLVFVC